MFEFSLLTNDSGSVKASKLTFDGDLAVMADPAWDGANHHDLDFMERHLKDINIIVLSHSTPEFISGFVLLCVKFPELVSSIKLYLTVPVNQLGRILTIEFYRARGVLGPIKGALVEVADVDEWFDKVTQLKYLQTVSLYDNRLVLTPYNAGHTLGGTFWLLVKKLEKVVYAPAWNHSKDLFLNSASFITGAGGLTLPLGLLVRPTALITHTDLGSPMLHKRRAEKFLQLVDATLANGGSVLLPTLLSGRFLEILHLVDQHLQSAPIPVLFLLYLGTKVLSYASNLLEWMSSLLIKEWEDLQSAGGGGGGGGGMGASSKTNIPFDASKVDLLSETKELVHLSGPKIVFCTGLDVIAGDMLSEALQYLCNDEKTTIILTEKLKFRNNINGKLYQEWFRLAKTRSANNQAEDGIAVPLEQTLNLANYFREEPITGHELKEFQETVARKRKERMMQKVRDKRTKNLLSTDNFDDSLDDDDEEEDEVEAAAEKKGEAPLLQLVVDAAADDAASERNPAAVAAPAAPADVDSFFTDHVKQTLLANKPLDIRITHKLKPRQAMFPYIPTSYKQKFDDYGEVIDIKMFQKAEDPAQKRIVMERRGGRDGPYDRRHNHDEGRGNLAPKVTPQETLNNQVLQKNLDTLFAPQKRVPLSSSRTKDLRVRCGLLYVDLLGLVDLRSLSLIVSLIKPYNLLLIPDETSPVGSETNQLEAVRAMFEQQQSSKKEQQFKKSLVHSARFMSLSNIRGGLSGSGGKVASTMSIEVLEANRVVRIGYDDTGIGGIGLTNFEVKLDDSVFENIKWQKIDGSYKVAQVYGELKISNPQLENEPSYKKAKTFHDYMNSATQFTLKNLLRKEFVERQQAFLRRHEGDPGGDAAAAAAAAATAGTVATASPKLAIGNIRLTELKKRLLTKNLTVEFKSEGTLVVNEILAIRKVTYGSGEGDDTGDIIIDGQMGPLYYEVKECIREMLAYV